jgi:hypothetical protein
VEIGLDDELEVVSLVDEQPITQVGPDRNQAVFVSFPRTDPMRTR